MSVIQRFDPWQSPLCTCPTKYSLNPYTGCDHRCIYCYSTFIPHFYEPRRKRDLLKRIEKDLKKLPKGSIISISNSSDPYLHLEEKYCDTRKVLELLQGYDLKILIVTKSDLIIRDIDLLKQLNSAVTITITTLKEDLYKKLEPNVPSPERRLIALKVLYDNGIRVGVRLDPIIPYLTDEEISSIIERVKEAGASHITTSTLKLRTDIWQRFKRTFPKLSLRLKTLYFKEGQRIGSYWYLPEDLRRSLIAKVRDECKRYGLSFSSCREGFLELQTSRRCDGSHLAQKWMGYRNVYGGDLGNPEQSQREFKDNLHRWFE